jgi:bifunctional DNA-binding transcriptional regulator/antitoxin component of YhaV-PrlF toxin-antitoxin module
VNRVIEVSLDDLGRTLIPAELRGRLGLSPEMTLIVEKGEKDGVRLRSESESLGDLGNVTRRERDRRVFDLLQRVAR